MVYKNFIFILGNLSLKYYNKSYKSNDLRLEKANIVKIMNSCLSMRTTLKLLKT